MSTTTVELNSEIQDWPDTRPVGGTLVPVLNALRERDQVVVTLDDLAELLPGSVPQSTVRAGWLSPMRTRGTWRFVAGWAPWHLGGFMELHARLRKRPDTPACISGKSVAQLHDWLWRPTGPAIGRPRGESAPMPVQVPHRQVVSTTLCSSPRSSPADTTPTPAPATHTNKPKANTTVHPHRVKEKYDAMMDRAEYDFVEKHLAECAGV